MYPWGAIVALSELQFLSLLNTLLRRPVLVAKSRRIAISFAWRRHVANLEVVLLLTSE